MCQNRAIVIAVDLVEYSGVQLQRFAFAPLTVRASLALRSLQHDQTAFAARRDVDFVEDFTFTRVCIRGFAVQALAELLELRLPPVALRSWQIRSRCGP